MTSVRTWVALSLTTAALTPLSLPARADEAGCLLIAAWAEARGEPLPVIEAVVSTIMNRAHTRGKSVCDAVMDPAAFTGVTPAMHELFVEASKPRANVPAIAQPHTSHDRAALAAVEAIAASALAGQLTDRSNGATHFYSPSGMRQLGVKSDPDWAASMVQTAIVGPFVFLRERKVPLPLAASNLPAALSLVTWGDVKPDSVLPVESRLMILDSVPTLALAPEGETIDFGTIDIVAQAKPPVPAPEIELASLATPDFLSSIGDAFSAAATGRIEAVRPDLAPGDILSDAVIDRVLEPTDDQVALESWTSAPAMHHVKEQGELRLSFTLVPPMELAREEPDDEIEMANAGAEDAAQMAQSERTDETVSNSDEPMRLSEATPQDIRPDAMESEPSFDERPAARLPRPRRTSAVRPWSSPDARRDSAIEVATEVEDFPQSRTESDNQRLWSPEPGTVLVCRGRDRGAILLTLRGTRVPPRVVPEIRCNG